MFSMYYFFTGEKNVALDNGVVVYDSIELTSHVTPQVTQCYIKHLFMFM